ncbi:MAG: TrmH family RNA methyltransferase [Spirosomataceae bacterium]
MQQARGRLQGYRGITPIWKTFEHAAKAPAKTNSLWCFFEGKNIHQTTFAPSGYIVMGNESNGIRPTIEKWITHKITIPRFGEAESLNVGIATAVVLDNWRRNRAL